MTTNSDTTTNVTIAINEVLLRNNFVVSEVTSKLLAELIETVNQLIKVEVELAVQKVSRVSTKRALTNELVLLVRDLHWNKHHSYNQLHNMLLIKYDINISGDAIRSCCEGETYKDVK